MVVVSRGGEAARAQAVKPPARLGVRLLFEDCSRVSDSKLSSSRLHIASSQDHISKTPWLRSPRNAGANSHGEASEVELWPEIREQGSQI